MQMPSSLNQRQALLVLNGLPHVGPIMLRHLMDAFGGDAVAVLAGKHAKLLGVKGVGPKAADALVHWADRFDLAKEVANMRQTGTRFFIQEDDKRMIRLSVCIGRVNTSWIALAWRLSARAVPPCMAAVSRRDFRPN